MPDLAFSELTFLNPRRESSNDLVKSSANRPRHKKDKAADSGANISRYFTSTKPMNHNSLLPDSRPVVHLNSSSGKHGHQRNDNRGPRSGDRNPSLPLVEHLEKPFLGFGSSGIYVTSPAWPPRNIGSTVDSPRGKAPSTRSTSHVSWSVSGAPSHHSPQLYHSDNASTRPPIQIERTRSSTTDVPLTHPETQYLDKGREQISVKGDTNQEYPCPIIKSSNAVPEIDFGNRSMQSSHQPISDTVKRRSTPQNVSSGSHGSPKETISQQSPPNDKFKATTIDKVQIELPCLRAPGSSGCMLQENSSILFDAELDDFLQKFIPKQTQSVHDLARQPPTHYKAPSVVDHENSTNLEEATDSLSAAGNKDINPGVVTSPSRHVEHESSINLDKGTDGLSAAGNKEINPGVINSPSHHDSTKPSEIPSTKGSEVQIIHTGRPCGLESVGPARQRSPDVRNSCRLGNAKDRSKRTAQSNTHDVFARNAWSGYNSIYQQQIEIGSYDSRSTQDCEKVPLPVDLEGLGNPLALQELVSDIHNEPDDHDAYENLESYNINGVMAGSGYHADSYHDESAMSAPHNIEELCYQSTLTRGTELDIPPYRNGLLHRNDGLSGDYLELEDSYPYLPNYDLNTSALPGNNDKYNHEPEEKCWLEGRPWLDVRPQLRAQNGTCIGDNRWMACVQQNDGELPGFWKPHKRH